MKKVILVFGLPGSGKTTLSSMLKNMLLNCLHLNADEIRKQNNDWDFSDAGILRQCMRMKQLAEESKADFVICDFVCPKQQYRDILNADVVVWCNTISHGRFDDTNKIFEQPINFNFCVDAFENMQLIASLVSNAVNT